jgi:alternate signal-mediated exported protein
MNKVVKGTIAAGAAVALLGGGAGSLAYWQASSSSEALTLQFGHVQLFDNGEVYTLNGEIVDLATLTGYENRLVPGDVVTYQHTFGIDVAPAADAVLNIAELNFAGTSPAALEAIETTISVATIADQSAALSFSPTNEAQSFNVTGRGAVGVTITITIPADLEDDELMVQGIFLQPLPVTLTQVAEPLPDAVG